MHPSRTVLRMTSDIVRDGIFAINKPCGESSAQIIRACQQHFNPSQFFQPMLKADAMRQLRESGGQSRRRRHGKKLLQVKLGHGGTLDPLATGVLVLGVGAGTKQLTQFLDCKKVYEATVVFGASTDTYDRVGRIISKRPYDHITREKVAEALESFRGKQKQVPPLYSALKMDGKPLYEYARLGKPIPREIEAREVDVLEIDLVEYYEPGTHNHRWPTEEASASERNLAEQVWRLKKQQETGKKLTAEEKEQDDQAIAAHESFKKKFEERQDQLIRDSPNSSPSSRNNSHTDNNNNNNGSNHNKSNNKSHKDAMMSGALGPFPFNSNRGTNLVPPPPDKNTPPPWSDEGPPAVRVRLKVTSGYYVRSFCHDLGAKLDSAGLMTELCRTRQSDFTVGGINCLEYEDLDKGEAVWGPKVADMLARWNGEPEGTWPGDEAEAAEKSNEKAKARIGGDARKARPGHSRSSRSPVGSTNRAGAEKRRRSPSAEADMPRKAAVRDVGGKSSGSNGVKPAASGRQRRSDDQKSWNGFDD